MEKREPVLFKDKKDCCACGACVSICPKGAVIMTEDECGYMYPSVISEKCIKCYQCEKVCSYQNTAETNVPLKTWVAVSKNSTILKNSASGGVYATISGSIIEDGGFSAGAAFDNEFNLQHIIVSDNDSLKKIQGSKYTQSRADLIYKEIRKKLENDQKILFSGCPCQVAGLKSYIGKEYDNLLTIDLICHGVPSNKMFKDYIDVFQKKENISIKRFSFRDKSYGWGINGTAFTSDNKRKKVLCTSSSYLYYFLHGLIYRKNCYSCKYASKNRPGDITIGDYWGIEKEHPEYLGKNGIDDSKGVSVIIANTEKGIKAVEKCSDKFELLDSTFEKASRRNAQLNHPSEYVSKREELIQLYSELGWEAVEQRFLRNIGMKKYVGQIKAIIPSGMKRFLKKMIH